MSGPVYVPTTYAGMHAHRWPGGSSPAPTYGYGTVRSLNYDPADNLGVLWYAIHKAEQQYDEERTRALAALGYRVLRYWNDDVLLRTGDVLDDILRHAKSTPPQPSPSLREREGV